jgi:L-ascorbate metabolism protein UlaG (beta-lactamase superfamily)
MIFLYIILGIIVLFVVFGFIVDRTIRSEYHGVGSDHFDGKHFYNEKFIERESEGTEKERGLLKLLSERFQSKGWKKIRVTQSVPRERVEGNELIVTFINHSSTLIQTRGLNILTDPVYSSRVSPFSFMGPKRYQNPGIAFENLPPIDLVLISHNHYDHMDVATLRELSGKFSPKIVVPLGNEEYLKKRGVTNVTEMEWWGEENFQDIKIISVPVQHFSARAISDRNRTLWSGYVLETSSGNIFFAGDTGYGPWVSRLRSRYEEGFRLALLPIGAYLPKKFFRLVHISPQEAIRIQKEIGAQAAVGIHFGTFRLASDGQFEGFETIKKNFNLERPFYVLRNGQSQMIEK